MGRCDFSHLQNPPIHSFLCRLYFRQLHQHQLNPELAHGDHPSHSLAYRARLWRLWFRICRRHPFLCLITQRHPSTDPGHFSSAIRICTFPARSLRSKQYHSKICGSSTMPSLRVPVRSESRLRFRLGCYPKMLSRPINPKSLLENSSRHLDSGVSFPPARTRQVGNGS